MKKALIALTLAGAMLFAAPLAASATYVDDAPPPFASNYTPTPGGSTEVTFPAGSFPGNTPITVTLTGEGVGAAVLASLRPMAIESKSITKNSAGDGSLVVTVTLPETALGQYAVVGTGGGITLSVAVTVVPTDAAGPNPGLPVTGGEIPFALVWGAGGAMLLGAALVLVMVTVRRQRSKA